jgi:hypothetical protein
MAAVVTSWIRLVIDLASAIHELPENMLRQSIRVLRGRADR